MNLQEAKELTERIKQTSDKLWELIAEAHKGKAWELLGYTSWRSYVETEFAISRLAAFMEAR